LLKIIGKVKESKNRTSKKAEEALRAQGKMPYLTAIEYQQLLELKALIHSKTQALIDILTKASEYGTPIRKTADDAGRKRQQ